jgi:hypothetical protein
MNAPNHALQRTAPGVRRFLAHPVKRTLYLAVPILIVAALVGGFFGLFNHFPAAALKAISNDSGLVFYSIDPSEGPTSMPGAALFHDWPILGQTVLSRPQDRKMVNDSLRRAARGAWDIAACFNPRHAIRATDGTETYDVLLCFECGQAAIYLPGGQTKWIPIHGSPDSLNQLLTAAHVPLARQ